MSKGAYFGCSELKRRYVRRAETLRQADRIRQNLGRFWTCCPDGVLRGGAMGSLVQFNEGPYAIFEEDAGVPADLNAVADVVFEGLPRSRFAMWPRRFASAPRPGADLSRILRPFVAWALKKLFWVESWLHPGLEEACSAVDELYARAIAGARIDPDQASRAEEAAWAAHAEATTFRLHELDAYRDVQRQRARQAAQAAALAARHLATGGPLDLQLLRSAASAAAWQQVMYRDRDIDPLGPTSAVDWDSCESLKSGLYGAYSRMAGKLEWLMRTAPTAA